MTAVAILRLDRTPPALTWGPVTDAIGGETMTVAYTLDEGTLVSAELAFDPSYVIPVAIAPSLLTVDLPDDAPDGPAQLSVVAVGDVGNRRTYTLTIAVVGVIGAPRPNYSAVPAGGLPLEPERRSHRSIARVTSAERIQVTQRVRRTLLIDGLESLTRRLVAGRAVVVVSTDWRTDAGQGATAGLSVGAADVVAKTSESPRYEEELILIGLL